MKFLKRISFFLLTAAIVVLAFDKLWLQPRYVAPILMYHQIENSVEYKSDTISPANFDRQLKYLAEHQYRVIPLSELVEEIKSGRKLSRKTVVLTFDDGYANNFTQALPILKKYNFPATICLVPELLGQPGYLTWEQVRSMQRDPAELINFASHTMNHAYLPDTPRDRQVYEIMESRRVLEKKLGVPVKYFTYPIGGFTAEIKQLVKDSGYEAALTTFRGSDRFNRDLFELKRVRMSDRKNSDFLIWAKLNGYYNLFRKMDNPS